MMVMIGMHSVSRRAFRRDIGIQQMPMGGRRCLFRATVCTECIHIITLLACIFGRPKSYCFCELKQTQASNASSIAP